MVDFPQPDVCSRRKLGIGPLIASNLLPHCTGYVNGTWSTPSDRGTLTVGNPATGEILAEIPSQETDDTVSAIEAAAEAMRHPRPPEKRREWLVALADAMESNRDELGRIITLEQGKPLKEGIGEVDYAITYFRYFADQVDSLRPRLLEEHVRDCKWSVYHRPSGVAGIITPWNFPLAMLTKKLGAAIGAGCAMVAKPSELTPLTAVALWTLIDQLDFPAGLMNLLIGDPTEIGQVLCRHPALRVLSFTGSTEVGRILIRESAPYVKRLALELGGNAPFVVFDDADLPTAVDALMNNKFRAGGQTCVCANRIYVHRQISPEFAECVAERVASLRIGNGMDADTDIGPLINREAFDKVSRHVGNAISKGAKRLVGHDPERPANDWGCYYPATLLTKVTPEMEVCQEETFGPVVSVSEFESEASVVDQCNSTIYGLAAYVFTNDQDRAKRVVSQLQFGHVGLNTGTGPAAHAPFGGWKQSGFGREGGLEGLLEFCEAQAVAADMSK